MVPYPFISVAFGCGERGILLLVEAWKSQSTLHKAGEWAVRRTWSQGSSSGGNSWRISTFSVCPAGSLIIELGRGLCLSLQHS